MGKIAALVFLLAGCGVTSEAESQAINNQAFSPNHIAADNQALRPNCMDNQAPSGSTLLPAFASCNDASECSTGVCGKDSFGGGPFCLPCD